jgi:hypothetical protein
MHRSTLSPGSGTGLVADSANDADEVVQGGDLATRQRGQKLGASGNAMRDRSTLTQPGRATGGRAAPPPERTARIGLIIVVLILATVVVIGADYLIGAVTNPGTAGSTANPTASAPIGPAVPTSTQLGVVGQQRPNVAE